MSGFTWNGKGRAFDVPARDISKEEFEAMDGRQRGIVIKSGWYDPATAKADARADSKADKAEREKE